MTMRLDISIGPVQGFVSQSRRTRDLWGSSYLLAFLSAHAMRGAGEAGGCLVSPDVGEDRLYQWVCGRREGEAPRIGSLPNHFVVEVEGDVSEVAQAGIRSLNAAWERVCSAVWSTFVAPVCHIGNGTEETWSRQVESFWEVTWTAGDAREAGGSLLARRKRWRTHRVPAEPGDKCTVMHDRQELSGFIRALDGAKQDAFWQRVRDGRRTGLLDLRDNERLCAVAFVKRMFPKIACEALGWEVAASHWPSTVYVGAVPWIRRASSAVPQQAQAYADAVKRSANDDVFPMHRPPFGLGVPAAGRFPTLDASYLHREFVMSKQRCPLSEDSSPEARNDLAKRLRSIYDATDEEGRRLGPPPTFHAVILADGDRLGALVGKLGGESVSRALAEFTDAAPRIVDWHDGVAVYAGGDDVLAMIPVSGALDCARALSAAYRDAFSGIDGGDEATLSAAVVFAQVRLPLSQVLDEAHRLLDDVAKDRNGRDSLAAAVLKPGGLYCKWATTWIRRGPDGDTPAVDLLDALIRKLEPASAAEPGLSSALIYRIRDALSRLCGWDRWQPGNWGDVPGGIDIRAFLRAEVVHSLQVRMDDGAGARASELTAAVWNLLAPSRNPQGGDADIAVDGAGNALLSQAGVDALLLARFLADPEERESGP